MYHYHKQSHKTHILLESEEKLILNYINTEAKTVNDIPWSHLQNIQVRLRVKIKKINMDIPKPEIGISVDAWCSNNGSIHAPCGYRGVDISTGEILFNSTLGHGSNTIAEFLAIVHGLMYARKHRKHSRIYTDSEIAMAQINLKSCNYKVDLSKNPELVEKIWRAERWLSGEKKLYDVDKWFTNIWGEIPADFGNKR